MINKNHNRTETKLFQQQQQQPVFREHFPMEPLKPPPTTKRNKHHFHRCTTI